MAKYQLPKTVPQKVSTVAVAGTKTTGKRAIGKAVGPAAKRTVKSRSAKGGDSQARHDRNKRKSNDYTDRLIAQLTEKGCPQPETEHRFRVDRAWRFDLAWPNLGVACEIEGGVHMMGRHTRGMGFEQDAIKYATAAVEGWIVVRVTPSMIRKGYAAIFVAEVIRQSGVSHIARQVLPWEGAGEG